MDLIIQPEEVGILARPISQHIDREQLVAYITEVEQLQIRSALGGVLFSNIKQSPSAFAIIINGGIDEVGEVSGGIRKAMAYYVYARIIREGGTIPTRFGAVEKNDEYATRLEQERKNTIHRECVNIADTYMAEVVRYAKVQGWLTSEGLNPTRKMAYVVGDDITPKKSASVGTPTKVEADIVQGEGIIINGNIISVDYSEVASMHIVEGVERKADEAQSLATGAKESAERANTSAHEAMEVSTEAIVLANNSNKLANDVNSSLITETNERKAEDAKMEHNVTTLETAISNLHKADEQLANNIEAKQDKLTLTLLDNGNIRIGNLQGQTKDFMPATPSGDPMHYAYITAGALYNDTNKPISRLAPWKTEESWVKNADGTYTYSYADAYVQHLPKHWYLNGLGDITNEQMRNIIYVGRLKMGVSNQFEGVNIRTFLPSYQSDGRWGGEKLEIFCADSSMMSSIVITKYPSIIEEIGVKDYMFCNCSSLKHISPFTYKSGILNGWFSGCAKLLTAPISGLISNVHFPSCPLIYKSCILYLINNSKPTTAITIRLHPNAYVRIANQPDIIEALETKNADLASKGGSIALVSA